MSAEAMPVRCGSTQRKYLAFEDKDIVIRCLLERDHEGPHWTLLPHGSTREITWPVGYVEPMKPDHSKILKKYG